jgi:hypothetical protein
MGGASIVDLALLFAGCSGSGDVSGPKPEPTPTQETVAVREGEILFQDDFSDPKSGWDSAVREEGEAGYVEGAYRIFVEQAGHQVWSDIGGPGPKVRALRLEFEATQLAGTSGDLVGARCYTDVKSNAGYILGIAPADQDYYIGAFRGGDFRLLESSEKAVEAVRPLREQNQFRVECIMSPDGPIVLTLGVNGQLLVRAEDEKRVREFDAFGFFVDTTKGGAEAVFDDLVVTELVPR